MVVRRRSCLVGARLCKREMRDERHRRSSCVVQSSYRARNAGMGMRTSSQEGRRVTRETRRSNARRTRAAASSVERQRFAHLGWSSACNESTIPKIQNNRRNVSMERLPNPIGRQLAVRTTDWPGAAFNRSAMCLLTASSRASATTGTWSRVVKHKPHSHISSAGRRQRMGRPH